MSASVAYAAQSSVRSLVREHLQFEGQVQGVGFRPALARLANRHKLTGWVVNTGSSVSAQIQGERSAVEACLEGLVGALPATAHVEHMQHWALAPVDENTFAIRHDVPNVASDSTSTGVAPPADMAPCIDCLTELHDPENRRYRYPFINCTQCGPRDSILMRLPYERSNTSMRGFTMCPDCEAEYNNADDRRFHAQPIACARCGPQLTYHDAGGHLLVQGEQALQQTVDALIGGGIVAVKGIGGFQLLVDARNEQAVARLRARKHRPHKPFALLGADEAMVSQYVRVSAIESDLLHSAAAPIVLLHKRANPDQAADELAVGIAPGLSELGFMLPASPMHHLIARAFSFVLVATSANRSGEPMVVDEGQAFEVLDGIADSYLMNNRPIIDAVDDSVLRVVARRPLFIRRARGYAPTLLPLARGQARSTNPLIALGGHQKVSCAVTGADHLLAGPVIGDMESPGARVALVRQINRLSALRPSTTRRVVCDTHPDYFTVRQAETLDENPIKVGHHLAHIGACIVDNQISGPVLGVAFDGSGFGGDGTVRGGEFFVVGDAPPTRVASLLPFRLPGAQKAVTEPRRSAIGLLHTLDSNWQDGFASLKPVAMLAGSEAQLMDRMLAGAINSPYTSSVGRLFDAIASLLNLHQNTTYQGQAAMGVESAAQSWLADHAAPSESEQLFTLCEPSLLVGVTQIAQRWLDWRAWLRQALTNLQRGVDQQEIAFGLHQALAAGIVSVAQFAGQHQVVLSGGCFQNRLLTELTIAALRDNGFSVFWHRDLPPNDECLAVGQLWWAMREQQQEVA